MLSHCLGKGLPRALQSHVTGNSLVNLLDPRYMLNWSKQWKNQQERTQCHQLFISNVQSTAWDALEETEDEEEAEEAAESEMSNADENKSDGSSDEDDDDIMTLMSKRGGVAVGTDHYQAIDVGAKQEALSYDGNETVGGP